MVTASRTGSEACGTGKSRSTQGAPQAPWHGTLMARLAAFSPQQKIIASIALIVLIMTVVLASLWKQASAYVPLYDYRLSENNMKLIEKKLTEMGISHSAAESNTVILVAPDKKLRVRIELAYCGLPQREIKRSGAEPSIAPIPERERMYNHQIDLEADLTESIRKIEGVSDAFVKIAKPQDAYFEDERKTRASVLLVLFPGASLAPTQVKGIMHLVSSSVDNLDPEQVTVVNSSGVVLNPPPEGHGATSSLTSFQLQEEKIARERYYQGKLQAMLDGVLGPNRTRVVIDVTCDTATKRREVQTVGAPGSQKGSEVSKRKTHEQRYTSEPGREAGAKPLGLAGAVKGGEGIQFSEKDITEILEVRKEKLESVTPAGGVERITASVLVDNLKPDLQKNLENAVKTAIGVDDDRGDKVTVASIPFNRQIVDELRSQMASRPARTDSGPPAPFYLCVLTVANVLILAAFIPLAFALVKGNKEKAAASSVIMASAPGMTVSDIADLSCGITGRCGETKVSTTENLAHFAQKKPTEVAELLKRTWLSDK
jgi:flagellar M-ring protein FliF